MCKTFAYLPRNIVGLCGMQNAVWGAIYTLCIGFHD